MANYNQPTSPTDSSTFFETRFAGVKNYVNSLANTEFTTYDDEKIVERVIKYYTLKPLTLSKAQIRIDPNQNLRMDEIPRGQSFSMSGNNHRDLVYATWAIGGNLELISLRDSSGYWFDNLHKGMQIDAKYVFAVGLAESEPAMQEARNRIARDTAQFQVHLDSLNVDVEAFMTRLREELPALVAERRKNASTLKSAEDFLSS